MKVNNIWIWSTVIASIQLSVGAKNVFTPGTFKSSDSKRDLERRLESDKPDNMPKDWKFLVPENEQIVLPGSGKQPIDSFEPLPGEPRKGQTLLRTELDISKDISIFAGYVRDYQFLQNIFDNGDSFSVVLAPSDMAVSALESKPWEFPIPVTGKDEAKNERAIRSNILSFIYHHLHFGKIDDLRSGGKESSLILETNQKYEPVRIEVRRTQESFTVTTLDNHPIVANVIDVHEVDNGVIWILDKALVRVSR